MLLNYALQIYLIVDKDIVDILFLKVKIVKAIPALTNLKTFNSLLAELLLKKYLIYPAAAVLLIIVHFSLIL